MEIDHFFFVSLNRQHLKLHWPLIMSAFNKSISFNCRLLPLSHQTSMQCYCELNSKLLFWNRFLSCNCFLGAMFFPSSDTSHGNVKGNVVSFWMVLFCSDLNLAKDKHKQFLVKWGEWNHWNKTDIVCWDSAINILMHEYYSKKSSTQWCWDSETISVDVTIWREFCCCCCYSMESLQEIIKNERMRNRWKRTIFFPEASLTLSMLTSPIHDGSRECLLVWNLFLRILRDTKAWYKVYWFH